VEEAAVLIAEGERDAFLVLPILDSAQLGAPSWSLSAMRYPPDFDIQQLTLAFSYMPGWRLTFTQSIRSLAHRQSNPFHHRVPQKGKEAGIFLLVVHAHVLEADRKRSQQCQC